MIQLMKRLLKASLRGPLRAILGLLGYEIVRKDSVNKPSLFGLHKYRGPDGTFDYESYRQAQTEGNKQKLGNVWAQEENIAFLAQYIEKRLGPVKFGLCHGTRQGMEQAWFRKYLKCDVLGTEISDTAERFQNTIQWDFHEVKPEWIGAVDFIYSNSFDHSYDPEKCLQAWMSCVREGGICIIEHSEGHEQATELDPFGADIEIMPYLVLTWGKGGFCVSEILDAPAKAAEISYNHFLIIERR